jgi:hypothetical protein
MPSAFWSSTAWQSARQGIPEHIVVANNLREGLGVGRASWLSRSVQYLWIPCLDLSFGWDADVILLVHVDALFSSLLRLNVQARGKCQAQLRILFGEGVSGYGHSRGRSGKLIHHAPPEHGGHPGAPLAEADRIKGF